MSVSKAEAFASKMRGVVATTRGITVKEVIGKPSFWDKGIKHITGLFK